jgi:crotonobetainyl-CoA:carnitine CoA-transferase CaiB-like acyl-CoA transferase
VPDSPDIASSERPLAGLRVIDIATYIAAPYCATIMAEFGAEVIKVEMPKVGDPCRRLGSVTECGETLVWLSEARNKKSVTLNLKSPKGAAMLKRLVAEADVLTENFQPGTLEGWGLGWETLKEINPRLVMLRVSGYGQTGPYSKKPGFGRIGNAFGGISFLAGDPDRPPATPGSATLADYMSGLYGALGVLMAIRARDATGAGQVVDIGLYEPIFRILDELAPAYDKFGYIRQRMGAATVNVCPHSHYRTKDGRWIAIACTNDKIFARMAALMGCPEVAGDGIYGTIAKREKNRPAVDGLVSAWAQKHTQQEAIALCDGAEVPCGMVAAVDEIFQDPHYAARGNIARVKDPRIGDTPGKIDTLGPTLGAHNAEIYGRLLGMTAANLAALEKEGVI